MTITVADARSLVGRAVHSIVPDADVTSLADDADLRRAFELDSLDFLSFVEMLSSESGVRLDEDDYPDLATLAGCVDLLSRRSS